MSLIKAWAPYFRSSVRMHGRTYQQQGRVHQTPIQPGDLARATVHGTREYYVVVRGDTSAANASCTCPFFSSGQYCKHIWALLLDVHYNGVSPTIVSSAQNAGSGQADSDSASQAVGGVSSPGIVGASEAPTLAMPKAQKRVPGSRPVVQTEAQWIGRLSLLRDPEPEATAAVAAASIVPTPKQIAYVINLSASQTVNGLAVDVRQRQAMRQGWSPLKPLPLDAPTILELSDSLDRELCALLMGGRSLGEWAADASSNMRRTARPCLIAPGAWRSLIQRMAETGRCFLDDHEQSPQPLEWTGPEPWALWLQGLDNGDGLAFSLQLRRGDQRMELDQPVLLLGGPDGLVFYGNEVAPLDDRDAFHWIHHFRQGLLDEGKINPLRVPTADVGKFLERLYGLSSLPEIDLPDGLGILESSVAPVPHLELSSPTAADPGTAANAPVAPRGLLIAKLWFAYDQHHVRPGQPGRFLINTEALDTAFHQAPKRLAERNLSEDEMSDDVGSVSSEQATESVDLSGGSSAEVVKAEAAAAVIVRRDLRKEEQALAKAVSLGFRPDPNHANAQELIGTLSVRQMPTVVGQCLQQGWTVLADRRTIAKTSSTSLSIVSGVDWFELRGGLKFTRGDGQEEIISLPAIIEASRRGQSLITLGDGSQGLLPEQWLREHGLLAGLGKIEGDHLRFNHHQAAMLDVLLSKQELVSTDGRFEEIASRLRQFTGVEEVQPSSEFAGELRSYQRYGLGWLHFLQQFGFGGILADDMGLGKTVQVLAMLQAQKQKNAGPCLVVAPRSVVFNWLDEAARFTPQLRVAAYGGTERESLRKNFDDLDLVVTTYGLVRRDIEQLRKQSFACVILDEAQAVKNPGSQVAKAVRLLDARQRLALTGTPVENHLGDLWSIFEFLNPGMLGGVNTFARIIKTAVAQIRTLPDTTVEEAGATGAPAAEPENNNTELSMTEDPLASLETDPAFNPLTSKNLQSTQVARQLSSVLRPFILRRTKAQVLRELPPKTEQTILCEMEGPQRTLYDNLAKHYRQSLLSKIDSRGMGNQTVLVLEALLRLRQAACHPGLLDPQHAETPSAKIEALLEHLEDIIEEGHKALVFSQFTSFLELVRKPLDARGVTYEYLDGQTRQRKKHVERFQTDPNCSLFLISLKAGGLGLNLTAAEYVFILDPWWNPAVENQAIDRAHRIGQQRHVFAYRLISQNTVEERIAQLQQKKRALADAIIGQEESILTGLTRDDLERLLS